MNNEEEKARSLQIENNKNKYIKSIYITVFTEKC